MVFRKEQEDWSVITPMALAHPLYSIRSRSRNKRRNLWVGWCNSSRRHLSWSVSSIYHCIHTMYHSCILSKWHKLFLRNIYIPRVGLSMAVCWMIWYCYSFLYGFKGIFYLYNSGFSISWYGCRYRVTLCDGQLHSITVYRVRVWVCVVLVFSVIVCFTNFLMVFFFIMIFVNIPVIPINILFFFFELHD